MAKDPRLGYMVVATVTSTKGKCMLLIEYVRVSR
jgi:hypothetical protein